MIQALTRSKGSRHKSDGLSTHNLASKLRACWTRERPVAIGSVQRGQGVHPFLANTYKQRYRQAEAYALSGMREKLKVSSLVDREVERLFSERPAQHGENCRNPVTGDGYVHGEDPIEPQKEAARRALFNREWFAIYGPADVQPLPISSWEWEAARRRGHLLHYLLGSYARSLDGEKPWEHPSFEDYASGVLWEAERVNGIIGVVPNFPDKAEVKKRFPPRKLAGIGPGFGWYSPKAYAEVMPSYRRSILRGRRWRRAKSIKAPQELLDLVVRLPASLRATRL
jgi:hypothetical protein